jgi:uncharacterized membrane protein YbhN (UPF0104 family)
VLTGSLLGFFFSQLEWQTIVSTIGSISLGALGLGALMMWLNFIAATVRFQLILKSQLRKAPFFMVLFKINLLGSFAAHLGPVGPTADLARFGYARFKLNLPTVPTTHAILMDRLFSLTGLAVVGVCTIPIQLWFDVSLQIMIPQLVGWIAWLIFVFLAQFMGNWFIASRWRRFQWFLQPILEIVPALLGNLRSILMQIMIAICYCGTFALLMWIIALDMNSSAPFLLYFSFSPIILLSQSLPIFYAGWGGREVTALLTLSSITYISEAEALSVALASGIVFFIASLPGCFIFYSALVSTKNKVKNQSD